MTLQWLLGWWNLVFIVPFVLGLMYLGLYTLTGLTFGDTDADVDVDHDIDAHLEVGHDVDTDADVDADADHDVDQDADHDADDGGRGAVLTALSWIGIGQMPLSLVMMIHMLCWGAIGFAGVQLTRGRPIGMSVALGGTAGAFGASLITHLVARVLGPRVFRAPSTARRWHQLLGSRGVAMYSIDEQFGMVSGRDERGELFQAACRVSQGQSPIEKGEAVELIAYAAKERMFYVVRADSATTPRKLEKVK